MMHWKCYGSVFGWTHSFWHLRFNCTAPKIWSSQSSTTFCVLSQGRHIRLPPAVYYHRVGTVVYPLLCIITGSAQAQCPWIISPTGMLLIKSGSTNLLVICIVWTVLKACVALSACHYRLSGGWDPCVYEGLVAANVLENPGNARRSIARARASVYNTCCHIVLHARFNGLLNIYWHRPRP